MPPPFSAAVLRAIIYPYHIRSSFLHHKKDPSHFLHGSVRKAADADLRRIAAPNPALIFDMHKRRVGCNESWPTGIRSSRVCFSGGERKCTGGGVAEDGKKEGGQMMNSLYNHRYGIEEPEEMDSGYKQLLQQQGGGSYSKLLTLPTALTIGRVAAVPLLVYSFHMNGSWATTTTTGIFLVAACTDWLDGYLARKMQLGTTFGAFLDPVADKLMVAATLVLLCTKPLEVAFFGVVPWILTVPAIAIIGREITMSAVREWAASQNSRLLEAVAVNNLGKWKTATQMIALTILLLTRDPSLTGPGFLVSTGVLLLYVSAGLALWSLAVYMRKIWRFMIK